ncbi:MAG: transglycosylase domain-containing protein, partial [Candidatus Dormibacteraeota bacterium]|nr:transglycosylase domain-containing protein [Candidatus Dormibacteraeota bacterium]
PLPPPPPSPVRARRSARRELAVTRMRSRRNRRSVRRVPRLAIALVSALIVGIVVVAVGGQVAFALITSGVGGLPQARALESDSIVTDAQGNIIAELHPDGETRLPVALSQTAATIQTAIVDIEDRAFWTEGPIDVGRMVASAWHDLRHDGATQGASTIPMQLAKVLYLTDDQSFDYKLRQIGFAGNIVGTLSKHDILEAYLNDIFYGEGATGIEAASHVYFGIPASQLDLAQSAMLAGLPNAPSVDDPLVHPDAAAARQQQVLQAMVSAGHISQAQADAAAAEKLTFAGPQVDDINTEPAFVARVVSQARTQLHLDPMTAGLRITTTLDPSLQAFAQQTVQAQVQAVRRLNVGDGALVSVVPQTGNVVAYVGSANVDAASSQIDMASVARQPGSTFKLFTYSTAIAERKITMVTPVLDGPLTLPKGGGSNGEQPWSPLDYDRTWHGVLPVAQAFPNSLNIPAIRTELYTGIPDILSTARNFGVTTLNKPNSAYGPSMTLGTYPIPLYQMAQAVTTFADQGRVHPVTFITSVHDISGRQLYSGPGAPKQVMDPGAVYIVNQILTNDRNRQLEFGLGSDLTLTGHLVSAKTGTSEDFRDNLTIGWTPQLVTATWVGNANDSPMHGTTGITGAAPIWHAFMLHALKNIPDNWPAAPADVYAQPAGSYAPAWFLQGTTAQTAATALVSGRTPLTSAVDTLVPPTNPPGKKKKHH